MQSLKLPAGRTANKLSASLQQSLLSTLGFAPTPGAVAYSTRAEALAGTDSTDAINTALATQGPVVIPPGYYLISATIAANRNGAIMARGVHLVADPGAVFDPILRSDDADTGMVVVFDHSRLNRGVVYGPFYIDGNGAANSVAFSGSQSSDATVEPNNTLIKPDATGCTWAVWGPQDNTPTAGMLTGNHYVDLASSCANGVMIQQNQDDVAFSGSTRIRSVTGVAVEKTAGVNTHMGTVFIGLQTGATGVNLGDYANTVTFDDLFIESETGGAVTPVVLDGIGVSSPTVVSTLIVNGRFTVNAPDGTSWIRMDGLQDKVLLRSVVNLDYNGARPTSALIELVYADSQGAFMSGDINYDGALDARMIKRPAVNQVNDASVFRFIAWGGHVGKYIGPALFDDADKTTVDLVALLINSATDVATRYPLIQRSPGKVCRLEGAVTKVNAGEAPFIAGIPVGCRPLTSRTFAVPGVAGGLVNVRSDGVIETTVATGDISLDGITYQAV